MRPPIRIRSFILGSVLVLLVAPTLAGGAAWLIERDLQQAAIQQRLNTAVAYLTTHRTDLKASLPGFASLLGRLDLLADLSIRAPTPQGKAGLYLSPTLQPTRRPREPTRSPRPRRPGRVRRRLITAG